MSKHFSPHTRVGVSALSRGWLTWPGILTLLTVCALPVGRPNAGQPQDLPRHYAQSSLRANLSRLQLSFEENRGQTDEAVRFVSRRRGYTVYLTRSGALFEMAGKANSTRSKLSMELVGAAANAAVEGLEALPGKSNYFIGNEPKEWRTDIPTFARVRQRGVYPGIDVVYYGNQQQVEYDFLVEPQSDPRRIKLAFDNAGRIELDKQGNLLFNLGGQQLKMRKPIAYQQASGKRREVESGYTLSPNSSPEVGFWLGDYDHSLPLVIDPVVDFSTYLGGSGTDIGYGIAVDIEGNVYVTGQTSSLNFPTQNPFQAMRDGANDAFVMKLKRDGSEIVFSTYIGGRNPGDKGAAVAVDEHGNVYFAGETNSLNFPTHSPAQPMYRGNVDAFVVKLSNDGNNLIYSTYWGGTLSDAAFDIAIDQFDNAYVTGRTRSTNFPTKDALQPTLRGQQDAFISKFTPDGAAVYSTYLGGDLTQATGRDEEAGYSIAVDPLQNAYIAGFTTSPTFPLVGAIQSNFAGVEDGFVAKINAAGSALVYSTFLGGNRADEARAIAIDALGNAYVTGYTFSIDFPTTSGVLQRLYGGNVDAFVTKINATGSAFIYSTFLGGNGVENTGLVDDITPVGGIDVDSLGNAYVTGKTESENFPVVRALQSTLRGDDDAFVAKIDPVGSELIYSTYLGSTFTGENGFDERGLDIAVDGFGNAYLTGQVLKNDFLTVLPVQPNYGGGLSDAFITKISASDIQTITTFSAASFTGPAFAPEEIATTFGASLASGTEIAQSVPLPTSLLGTTVKLRDRTNLERLAPLFFVSTGQINFQIPLGTAEGKATITVTNSQNATVSATVLIGKTAPGLFAANANGKGVAAAVLLRVKSDGSTAFEPIAEPKDGMFEPLPIDFGPDAGAASDQLFLILFGTGWRGRSALDKVIAQIGNVNTPVMYAGSQNEFVGEDQINLQLPRTLAGLGKLDVAVTVDGQMANLVQVAFK